MNLTTHILVNAVLGIVVVYGIVMLLVYGIRAEHRAHRAALERVSQPELEREQLAA